ncbi:MAG: dihydropteroate synthase [Spirochaetota bacterium]|nr:MAG: dihydropteroate synthase [Spirochaetota bacterium]
MIILGEKINTVNPKVADALKRKDKAFFQNLALSQAESGVMDVLDVNVGSDPQEEPDNMRWAVSCIEEVLEGKVPLSIDSSGPETIIAGIDTIADKEGIFLNSITLEENRYKDLLPLAKEYNLNIIALPIERGGIPQSSDERLRLAERIVSLVEGYGIALSRLFVDCLVEPVSLSCDKAQISLDTVNKIKKHIPGVNTFICLSAISFGLPGRRLINRQFLSLLMREGIDSVILDPLDQEVINTLYTTNLLLGNDEFCQEYIKYFRSGHKP